MVELLAETAEKNEEFFKAGPCRESWSEIVELVNDAIDNLRRLGGLPDWKGSILRSAVSNYLVTLSTPLSFGIYMDLLIGNMPCCFLQLRVLVEQMGKTRYADREYSDEQFFQDRLRKVEDKIARRELSLTGIIRGCLGEEAVTLWRDLSERWVHVKSLGRVVEAIEADPSRLNLVMPTLLTEADLPDLVELQNGVATFRRILAQSMKILEGHVEDQRG
jgi:hypothetical protein